MLPVALDIGERGEPLVQFVDQRPVVERPEHVLKGGEAHHAAEVAVDVHLQVLGARTEEGDDGSGRAQPLRPGGCL